MKYNVNKIIKKKAALSPDKKIKTLIADKKIIKINKIFELVKFLNINKYKKEEILINSF